jgi:5-methylcytosine-specific restriction endonuclease McrA
MSKLPWIPRAPRLRYLPSPARLPRARTPHIARPSIPADTRIFVWNRDGGKCVSCSSRKDLQFDHVIPFSLGGATTADNLELLCSVCNQKKKATLSVPAREATLCPGTASRE